MSLQISLNKNLNKRKVVKKYLNYIIRGDEDLMEAVEKIKEATFDINTIGLYDVEKDRKWKEEAKIAYAEKKIITALLNNGMNKEEVTKMTGIPLEKVKQMGLL